MTAADGAGRVGPGLRVLLVAPDLHCATGATPRLLAGLVARHQVLLFRGRDLGRRAAEFRSLAAASDVVHWHANLANFPAAAGEAERLYGRVAQVATVHHVEPGEERKVEVACELVDVLHVPSADTARSLDEAGVTRPVVVAPYVVDWRHRGRRRRRSSGRGLRIGWSGQAHEVGDRKQLDRLVDAVALLRRTVPGAGLVLQGRIPASVVRRAAHAGVPTTVLGWEAWRHKDRLFRLVDLYASVSTVEGGPLPVLEAALHGVPVLCTRVGLGADLIARRGAVELPMDDPEGQAAVLADVQGDRFRLERLAHEGPRAAFAIAGPAAVDAHEALWTGAVAATAGNGPRPLGHAARPDRVAAHNRRELARDQLAEAVELLDGGSVRVGLEALAAPVAWSRIPPGAARTVAATSFRSLGTRLRTGGRRRGRASD